MATTQYRTFVFTCCTNKETQKKNIILPGRHSNSIHYEHYLRQIYDCNEKQKIKISKRRKIVNCCNQRDQHDL